MNNRSKVRLSLSLYCLSLLCAGGQLQAQTAPTRVIANAHPALPAVQVPGALGVNIHFTDAREGELVMIEEGGFRIARMDFAWSGTEKTRGEYDFSAYNRLLKGLETHHIQPLFILDYSNSLYDEGVAPHTEAGRTAFAKWAGAAAAHFKGHKVLWEMWNEPNGDGFWKPKENVADYIKLGLVTGQAIRREAPGECYIGPAVSGVDLRYLEACFKGGLLELWDAVSVHPYRQGAPESVEDEYRKLRLLIERYKPKGKTIPILSGEWGYSSAWRDFDDARQGKYLPRQWLTNLMNGIPVSVWYDWHDDGTDAKEGEHHFGTTENEYFAGRTPVYAPKPSYIAARTLTRTLSGLRFNKRLALDAPNDYLLLFSGRSPRTSNHTFTPATLFRDDLLKLAVWTTGAAHDIVIPASAGDFKVVNYLGEAQPNVATTAQGLRMRISDMPLYLEPIQRNAVLSGAAQTTTVPLEYLMVAPNSMIFPDSGTRVVVKRDSPPTAVQVRHQIGGLSVPQGKQDATVNPFAFVGQTTQVLVTNPLALVVEPTVENTLQVKMENPSGFSTSGQVSVNGGPTQKVDFVDSVKILTFPAPASNADGSWMAKVKFQGKTAEDSIELNSRFVPLRAFAGVTPDNLATSVVGHSDGNAAIASEVVLSVTNAPEAAPGGGPVLKLSYRFDPGWKFANVQPVNEGWWQIEGQPKQLGMWVYGDGSGHQLRMRYSDSTGQTFQPNGMAVDWKGWRFCSFPTDGSGGHWNGANDGQLHGDLRVESLFLLDSAQAKGGQGEIYISSPTWIY